MRLRLPVALSVSFADSSPTGGAKSTPVGAGQVVVRQTCSQLRLTRCSPGLTAVRLAPPSGELASEARLRGEFITRNKGVPARALRPGGGALLGSGIQQPFSFLS